MNIDVCQLYFIVLIISYFVKKVHSRPVNKYREVYNFKNIFYNIIEYLIKKNEIMSKAKYILLNKLQEKYIDMYHEYYVLNWTWYEIAKYHECSQASVSVALNWVDKNKLQIPGKGLLSGAITAVKLRLKQNKALYNTEYEKKRKRNNKFLLEVNKEVREDEKLLFNLQNILTEKYDVDLKMSSVKILQLINDATNEKKETPTPSESKINSE